jgi:hypothetical protein
MFIVLSAVKVIRFGKLLFHGFQKSFPFWITPIGCKDTNFPQNHQNVTQKK